MAEPTRIPGFYNRRYGAAEEVDRLDCPECNTTAPAINHQEMPVAGTLVTCDHCGLESRVPALKSRAGMDPDTAPPLTNDRS
jgi:predicted Zn finger-like uncharacterized protein